MMSKWLALLVMLILFLPIVMGYQQGHLVFDLDDSWEVKEQRVMAQSFAKEGLFLDVRHSDGEFLSFDELVSSFEGEVLSNELVDEVNETVLATSDKVYVFAFIEFEGGYYLLTGLSSVVQKNFLVEEMRSIYPSLAYSSEAKFVEAPWEKELKKPGSLPYFERNPISWFKVVIFVVVLLLILKVFFKKKQSKKKYKKK